jgi:hypothetical protein
MQQVLQSKEAKRIDEGHLTLKDHPFLISNPNKPCSSPRLELFGFDKICKPLRHLIPLWLHPVFNAILLQ